MSEPATLDDLNTFCNARGARLGGDRNRFVMDEITRLEALVEKQAAEVSLWRDKVGDTTDGERFCAYVTLAEERIHFLRVRAEKAEALELIVGLFMFASQSAGADDWDGVDAQCVAWFEEACGAAMAHGIEARRP